MKWLDLSNNQRIPMILELVGSMNRLVEPQELIERFIGTMRRAYGSRCHVQVSTRGLGPGQYRIARVLSPEWREGIRTQDAHSDIVRSGGILGEIVSRGGPSVVHDVNLKDDPALGAQMGQYCSAMACPLVENEMADWLVLLDARADAFDAEDLEEMILRANLVAAMVNNLDTARKLMKASLQIRRELEQISRIQEVLLPEAMPEVPGLKLAASYRTFDSAGGDMYDIARVGEGAQEWGGEPDGRWALLIGDVSGHGPAAAVVMAMVHSIMHTYPVRPKGPAEVLRHVNRHLCAKRIEHSFVTAFLGFYDPKTRMLRYARAGHEPPLLKEFPHSGRPIHLEAVGELPLGIMPDVEYSEASVQLKAGQTLVLYTDGIIDARNSAAKAFGIDGIEDALIACTGAPECAIRHINEALERHQGDARPADDQTVVAVQVKNDER